MRKNLRPLNFFTIYNLHLNVEKVTEQNQLFCQKLEFIYKYKKF